MPYATNSHLSVEAIIAQAKEELNMENTSGFDFYFEDRALEGIKELKSLETYVHREAILPIDEDFTARLPKDFVKFNDDKQDFIRFINGGETVICPPVVYTGGSFFKCNFIDSATDSLGNNFTGVVTVNISEDCIFFSNNANFESVAIAYQGIRMNGDDVFIPESHGRAITAYICWRFSRRFFKDFPQYNIASYQKEWSQGKRMLRGESVVNQVQNPIEKARLSFIMNRVI